MTLSKAELGFAYSILDHYFVGASNICHDYEVWGSPENLECLREILKFNLKDEPEELQYHLETLKEGENNITYDFFVLEYIKHRLLAEYISA